MSVMGWYYHWDGINMEFEGHLSMENVQFVIENFQVALTPKFQGVLFHVLNIAHRYPEDMQWFGNRTCIEFFPSV